MIIYPLERILNADDLIVIVVLACSYITLQRTILILARVINHVQELIKI